jgi:hypothetical protein
MADSKEYKKSLEDEIDWKIIDQLHAATLNFSTTSLELKKLFFVVVGIAVPTLIKLAGDGLDLSLFITIYLLSLTFWLLDSFTYFYQEKLREKMDSRFTQIRTRNVETIAIFDYTLENSRTKSGRIWRSLTNLSVRLYMFSVVLNTLAFVLYLIGVIE